MRYNRQQPAAKPKIWSKPPYLESVGKSEGGKRNPAPAVPRDPTLLLLGGKLFVWGMLGKFLCQDLANFVDLFLSGSTMGNRPP